MTTICPLITIYEEIAWEYLTDVFRFGLKASELGFTNHIVYRITEFYNGNPSNCEVFAFNDNVYEVRRGADIDLFIEDGSSGKYHFFMLQAKMMNYEGKYKDIKKWSRNAQFYKLIRNAKKENAFPLYLLYNGKTVNSNLGNKNLGLSIVEATEVKNLRLSQRKHTRVSRVTFDQLHPFSMKPFHILFCDIPNEFILPKAIDGKSIYKGYPYINRTEALNDNIQNNGEPEDQNDPQALRVIKERNLAPIRIIIKSQSEKSK